MGGLFAEIDTALEREEGWRRLSNQGGGEKVVRNGE